MSYGEIRGALKDLIKSEKKRYKQIQNLIKNENPGMSNTRYLRLLAAASYHSNRISMFEDHLKRYRKRNVVKRAFVNTTSKVKLVSTKIGAIVWVDAGNYAQLIGKQIGDTVLMHNSTFRVAGIY